MRESGEHPSRFAESLRKIGYSLLKLFRGDFLVYLLFLGITFFFWWSQTMSQDRQTLLKVPLTVTGVPDDVRIVSEPVGQLTVSLSGKGSDLRKSGRRWGKHVIHISHDAFSHRQGRASLSTQRLRDSIAVLLPPSVAIRQVEPDSLVYQYVSQRTMMLPVEFTGDVESQDQFFLERIEFNPDSVRVSVLASDTMAHHVVADVRSVTLSADTLVGTVAVKRVPGVLMGTDRVQMTVVAQQYTEKSLDVPVTGINFPHNVTLKSFPSKVPVSVWVKMSEYDRIRANDFQVVVDYNEIAGRNSSKAALRILTQPANVRNVRLQTRTVDYLMETNVE